MDVHFWASRRDSSKLLSAMQTSTLISENHLSLDDDDEGDDDSRDFFPCPYCCMDIEVPVLCSHLQEDHCFNVKNAVCPVCAANMGKDIIGHFVLQHAHLLKRRRSHRSGLWINSPTMLGKELQELSSFLFLPSTNGRGNTPESAPDSVLTPFLCSITPPEGKVNQEKGSDNGVSITYDVKSTEASTVDGIKQEDYEEKTRRAEFFQHLIMSTIF